MSYHHWMSTDAEGEDQCIGCGVVTPDFGEGVVSDHGPLPIFCPGPEGATERAHHFAGDAGELTCHFCLLKITPDTMPNEIDWNCEEI